MLGSIFSTIFQERARGLVFIIDLLHRQNPIMILKSIFYQLSFILCLPITFGGDYFYQPPPDLFREVAEARH